MARNISFYKVTNNVVKRHSLVFDMNGTHISSKEIREKAIELYNKYKCDGILVVTVKKNLWGDPIGGGEIYYNGMKFSRDTLEISFVNGWNINYKKH